MKPVLIGLVLVVLIAFHVGAFHIVATHSAFSGALTFGVVALILIKHLGWLTSIHAMLERRRRKSPE